MDKDEQIDALLKVAESCASKLAELGQEFSSVRFTDRHGDGPICKGLANYARDVADRVRKAREQVTA